MGFWSMLGLAPKIEKCPEGADHEDGDTYLTGGEHWDPHAGRSGLWVKEEGPCYACGYVPPVMRDIIKQRRAAEKLNAKRRKALKHDGD